MLILGRIRGTRQGFAFLQPDDGSEEIYIAQEDLGGAIHGDRVEASVVHRSMRDFRPSASVDRILERTRPICTGNVIRLARTPFVVPDTPVLPDRIRLRTGGKLAPIGAKVLFRVEETPAGAPLIATLERVLGDAEDPALDAIVVATLHQLPGRFPDAAIDEAVRSAAREDPEDRSRRASYADRLVLTIDPEEAKDFDDAVSLQKDSAGYHLQVHIADVSWFVAEGGSLDREAARRGNSVYFPAGVIPMLPEILSTRTASLVPGEERRVLTVEIDVDRDGAPRATRVREGLIRSAARLHYGQAQRMLERDEGDLELRRSLREMAELAGVLRRRRFEHGGFDLEVPETEVRLDATGFPCELRRHRTLDSHRLIEEFMVLANRAVGGFVVEHGMPLLFRVHGEPDPASLERFAEVVLVLMPGASIRDLETIPALRRFVSAVPDGPLKPILHAFFLRSLKQAVYSSVDVGHFGLGIDRYCHFTSPIRRYPDLFNHRVVRWILRHPRTDPTRAAEAGRWREESRAVALTCTRTEQVAERAEREIVRLKVLRWAEGRLGESFPGRVVGITPSGLFVELEEVPVEGFIRREGLEPQARYQEERLAFVEGRSRWELRLGDRVVVQIVRVDLRDRHLDFHLVKSSPIRGGKRTKPERPRRRRPERRGQRCPERQQVKTGRPVADRRRGSKGPRSPQRSRSRRGGKR